MGAPLSERYQQVPAWWDGVELPSIADHPLPSEADVVVVGAGYTGLAAGWELARRGRSVVVVDAGRVGAGASSRNGGMAHPGVKHGVAELVETYGQLGRELYDVTVDAFEGLEKLIADEGVECDYVRSGHLHLAHRPGRVGELHEAERAYVDVLGEEVRFLDRQELASEIGSDVWHGGLLVARSGALHPAKWLAGLARLAVAAGADVHERTEARAVERRSARGFAVQTDRGTVGCRDVLVATNGYTGPLVPWLRRRILTIGSYIVATERLDPSVAAAVSPKGRMFFDTKNFLYYWRLSPDRRVLFGGRTSFAPTTVERSREYLHRALARVHPQVAHVPIEFAWGGNVALTVDRMPHFGRVDGVAYAMGYCGTGVALSQWFGRLAGAWLAGGDPPAFTRLDWRPVPPPARVPWLLPVAGWYYQLRDRLG